jgi:hypothetical protein
VLRDLGGNVGLGLVPAALALHDEPHLWRRVPDSRSSAPLRTRDHAGIEAYSTRCHCQIEYLRVHSALGEMKMALLDEIKGARDRWRRLTVYLKFEHAVVLVLTALLSLIIISAI